MTRRNSNYLIWLLPTCLAIIAFLARWESVQQSGGFYALLGYDEGVYFGAATSFVSGLMPYRDFVLVHPPGSVVFLSPFALFGKLTSDSSGWVAGRVFVMLIGAFNAAMVFVIARRISLVAAVVSGGLYAVWAPVIHVERTTMLEAFALSAIVIALWALRSKEEQAWRLILAGAFLGMGSATKLWGLVPLAVIVIWLLLGRAWRAASITTGASILAFMAIVIPFAALDPHRMFDLVIRAQMGRGRGGTHELGRLARMFNVDLSFIASSPRFMTAVGLIAVSLVTAAMAIAWWKVTASRIWVALLAVQLIVLMAVPVYFEGYSSFITPALMLVTGATVSTLWAMSGSWARVPTPVTRGVLCAVLVSVALISGYRSIHSGHDLRPDLGSIAGPTQGARCVGSDSAGLLILTNTLTRNVERGCPTIVDFDGTVYSFDAGSNPLGLTSTQRREESVPYQRAMRAYFASNDVILIHRARADVLDPVTRQMLLSRTTLYRQPGLRVYGLAQSSNHRACTVVGAEQITLEERLTASSANSLPFHRRNTHPTRLVQPVPGCHGR